MVQRSYNNSNTNGGVAYVNANNDSSNTNSARGSRLAFRGACHITNDVAGFKRMDLNPDIIDPGSGSGGDGR